MAYGPFYSQLRSFTCILKSSANHESLGHFWTVFFSRNRCWMHLWTKIFRHAKPWMQAPKCRFFRVGSAAERKTKMLSWCNPGGCKQNRILRGVFCRPKTHVGPNGFCLANTTKGHLFLFVDDLVAFSRRFHLVGPEGQKNRQWDEISLVFCHVFFRVLYWVVSNIHANGVTNGFQILLFFGKWSNFIFFSWVETTYYL